LATKTTRHSGSANTTHAITLRLMRLLLSDALTQQHHSPAAHLLQLQSSRVHITVRVCAACTSSIHSQNVLHLGHILHRMTASFTTQKGRPAHHEECLDCCCCCCCCCWRAHLHVAGHHPSPVQRDQLLSLNKVGRRTLADGRRRQGICHLPTSTEHKSKPQLCNAKCAQR
jgi:hypothetical protein